MQHPLIVAHRGASAYVKENTLEAFEKAIALQANMIEFDVRRTKDRVLIICHDPELNGKPIRKMTYGEVLAIDPDVPTLEAALRVCRGRIRLDVELKEAGYEAVLVKSLLQFFTPDEFVITSFHPIAVKNIKHKFPQITVGFLFGELTVEFCKNLKFDSVAVRDRVKAMQADFIAPDWQLLDAEILSKVVPHLPIWVWTVNDPPVMEKLLGDRRIQAIITDYADIGLQVRDCAIPVVS